MEIIWDIAATRGKDNIPAILRDLDYKLELLRKDEEDDFGEDTPSERKIKQIIEEESEKQFDPHVVNAKQRIPNEELLGEISLFGRQSAVN